MNQLSIGAGFSGLAFTASNAIVKSRYPGVQSVLVFLPADRGLDHSFSYRIWIGFGFLRIWFFPCDTGFSGFRRLLDRLFSLDTGFGSF